LVSLVALGCVQRLHRTVTPPEAVNTVDRQAPFLKVHMRDGSLYVLSPWGVDEAARSLSGTGAHYGPDRALMEEGIFSASLDSVVLFETNVARASPSVTTLGIITGITAGIAIYCATNPRAWFVPTFYVTDGTRDVLQAEGFSASIAPSLEAMDVDALFRARPRGREVRVRMANEAYETHVVRYVDLLALLARPTAEYCGMNTAGSGRRSPCRPRAASPRKGIVPRRWRRSTSTSAGAWPTPRISPAARPSSWSSRPRPRRRPWCWRHGNRYSPRTSCTRHSRTSAHRPGRGWRHSSERTRPPSGAPAA
jgi:hypothetical protein